MPVSKKLRRSGGPSAVPNARLRGTRALVVVDNTPLQREAWAKFHTVRKRLDKVSRDLHRHEEVDTPAYEAWFYRTFPVQITQLRQLQEEVFAKGAQVERVQALGYLTGRSLKKLWREMKQREKNPELFDAENSRNAERQQVDEEDWADELFEEDEIPRRKGASQKGEYAYEAGETRAASEARQGPAPSPDAKAIYRRLVQRLHPDRGGEWTPKRERLWHDVQQAWSQGDADWLARLEVEWETANDQLGPTSPLSRLRLAIEELHGARRDLERKLRSYREAYSWRFTLREKDRDALRGSLEANLKHDLENLAEQLRYFDATISSWEARPRSRRAAHD